MICQPISHLYHCPARPWSDQNNKIGDNCIIFLKYLTNIRKYKQSFLSYLDLVISKMRFIKTLLHNSAWPSWPTDWNSTHVHPSLASINRTLLIEVKRLSNLIITNCQKFNPTVTWKRSAQSKHWHWICPVQPKYTAACQQWNPSDYLDWSDDYNSKSPAFSPSRINLIRFLCRYW